jgi:ferredoxin
VPKIEAETATGVETLEAVVGQKLVLALKDAGIDILHRCGGNAKCTTCRVEIIEGTLDPMSDAERNRLATEQNLAPNIRLSCQVRVQDDLRLRVLRQASVSGMDSGPRPTE